MNIIFLRLNINSWRNATFYFSCHFLIWQFFTHSSSRRLLFLFPPAMTLIIIMWKFIEPIFSLTFLLVFFFFLFLLFFLLNDVYKKRQIREMHDEKENVQAHQTLNAFGYCLSLALDANIERQCDTQNHQFERKGFWEMNFLRFSSKALLNVFSMFHQCFTGLMQSTFNNLLARSRTNFVKATIIA